MGKTFIAKCLGWMVDWRFDGKRGSFDLWRGCVTLALVIIFCFCYVILGKVSDAKALTDLTNIKVDTTLSNTVSISNQVNEVKYDIAQMRRAIGLPPRQRPVFGYDESTNIFAISIGQ